MMSGATIGKRRPGHRIDPVQAPAIWDAFIVHLATMPEGQVSVLPNMPCVAAYRKKRKRDADFDARARAVLTSRNLPRRPPITADVWARFLETLPAVSINRITGLPGLPSAGAIYTKRKKDNVFRAAMDTILHSYRRDAERRVSSAIRMSALRRDGEFVRRMLAAKSAYPRRPSKLRKVVAVGETLTAAVLRDELYAAASAVVSERLERHVRQDIIVDLVLAVLEGTVQLADLPRSAKEFTNRYWKMFGRYGAVSLDAPIYRGSTLTIGGTLSGDAQHYWEAALTLANGKRD
jgi:hypothetical protein